MSGDILVRSEVDIIVRTVTPAAEVLATGEEKSVAVRQADRSSPLTILVGSQGLRGAPGKDGDPGADSTIPGPRGWSAYEIAVQEGFSGTLSDWLASLIGPPGTKGDPGDKGDPGEKWFSGSGAPAGTLGAVGDWYFDISSGTVYEKTGLSTWVSRANLTGPQGPAGGAVGSIAYFPRTSAPSDYLKANGATLSRTAYAVLWAEAQASGLLSATEATKLPGGYGPGDGSTTFSIPDLRAEFIRGWDDGRGVDTGRVLGSSQSHGTEDLYAQIAPTGASPAGVWARRVATPSHQVTHTTTGTLATSTSSHSFGSGVAPLGTGETRPRNVALLPCIKYQ